jgi:uncharacterized membrane protein YhfC
VLYLTFVLEILVMLGFPVALWLVLRRRLGAKWGLVAAGGVTFAASQVAHIPLLAGLTDLLNRPGVWPFAPDSTATLVANAAILGLAAGVCEEVARYLVLRYWRREARAWGQGVIFGAGHGGVEAILLGLLVAVNFGAMVAMRRAGPEALGLSGDVLEQTRAAVDAYWSTSWYQPLLGGLERVFAIAMHIAWSLLVLRALTRDNLGWLAAAIFAHALVDGVVAGLAQAGWPLVAVEGVVLLFALGAGGIVVALRPRRPRGAQESTPPGTEKLL